MLLEPPDRRQLQRTFGRVLNQILDGELDSAPEGNGLDEITNNALNELAAHLKTPAQYTLAAYDAFAGQLSGVHADAAEAEMLAALGQIPGVSGGSNEPPRVQFPTRGSPLRP